MKNTVKNTAKKNAKKNAALKKPAARATIPPISRRATAAARALRRRSPPGAPSPSPSPSSGATPIRIARIAKGKKPQYFSDPATDKLLWMTLTLMEELSVTRDRLDAVENLLQSRKLLRVADIDDYRPAGAAAQRRNTQRAAYVDRMMRATQAELEELTGRDMPKSEAEIVAAVEA